MSMFCSWMYFVSETQTRCDEFVKTDPPLLCSKFIPDVVMCFDGSSVLKLILA